MPRIIDRTELAARLSRNDPRALAECYAELRPLVRASLRRRLPPEDADEVLHTTFFELWRSAHRYDPQRSLEGWVLGIAEKRTIDKLRRHRFDTMPIDEAYDLPAGDHGEDSRETAIQIRHALDELAPDQRQVLELAYFGGLTQVDIAEALGVPLGTVKARTFRGLKRLRAILKSPDMLEHDDPFGRRPAHA